jgi:hypothetical protein
MTTTATTRSGIGLTLNDARVLIELERHLQGHSRAKEM